ncbi:hypothetical protein B0J13DRAFT_153907 [Dactylonectria estremocensis]|uniref:Uncharacterized protein n=1 Tax=Dactylonectria estremocensis TaxID=1079267 RepID=A0A9P9DQF4_9HYPO|nr:hypothetical protein B0J13DRAFT_153907 [Dactylonectria estremocensis]
MIHPTDQFINMDHSLSSLRGLIFEIEPGYHATMILPGATAPDSEKFKRFMNMNHQFIRSRIVQLTPEFRVVLPERQGHEEMITIQSFMEDKSVGRSWRMAIQGSSSLMLKICRRLRSGDQSARDAVICHASGEQMSWSWKCEQCSVRDVLPGGCIRLQDNFDGVCSSCILQGNQGLCSARVRGECGEG